MMHVSESKSVAFDNFVNNGTAPVVMQILPALESGGVEQGVIDGNAAIIRAGGHSIVVSNGGRRVHEITRPGGEHIELPVHSKNPLTMFRNIGRLRKLIREHNVDIVHACSRAPAWSARRAVVGTPAHFVTSCHAAHQVGGRAKKFYNSAIASGERVIAVSHFLSDYLTENYGTHPSKIRVVHRGLPLAKFHPNAVTPERLIQIAKQWRIPDGAPIIMLPGRLTRIKGHMFLIDALVDLGRDDVFCVFVGRDNPKSGYRAELETYIENKGMSGQVRMVDHCDDMPAAYMIATVVVTPSIEPEGFGRIAIEAQAMGRPVIATDHGGAQETIVPDQTGWLVRPGDAHHFSKALEEALDLDNRDRAVLGTRAMSHVAENFTVETMCSRTLDVYAELLDEGRRQPQPSNDETRPLDAAAE